MADRITDDRGIIIIILCIRKCNDYDEFYDRVFYYN